MLNRDESFIRLVGMSFVRDRWLALARRSHFCGMEVRPPLGDRVLFGTDRSVCARNTAAVHGVVLSGALISD